MSGDTGSPRADAEADFLRARRLQVIAALTARLLGKESGDRNVLSFQEVVDALGLLDEVALGRQMIPVEKIVGSVDRVREFDPKFRPRTGLSRQRFERIDEAVRAASRFRRSTSTGSATSTSSATGTTGWRCTAHSTCPRSRRTCGGAHGRRARRRTGPLRPRRRELRKLFLQRVPVPRSAYYGLILSDPQQYPWFAEMVEAWAARLMFAEGICLDRREAAGRWYTEEFAPVVKLIEDGDLLGQDETEADAYMRVAGERYAVFHHHDWNAEIIAELGRRR